MTKEIFQPEVDLFASTLNHEVAKYMSWKHDPKFWAIDALDKNWSNLRFYAFPKFSLIERILNKVAEDLAEEILLIPYWTTQALFTQAMMMLVLKIQTTASNTHGYITCIRTQQNSIHYRGK